MKSNTSAFAVYDKTFNGSAFSVIILLLFLFQPEILARTIHYIQELRGVSNYYSLSKNWKHVGSHLHWLCKASLMKTLACKARVHHTQIYARLNSENVVSMRSGNKVIALHPPRLWRRYVNEYPDWKPSAYTPDFQSLRCKI